MKRTLLIVAVMIMCVLMGGCTFSPAQPATSPSTPVISPSVNPVVTPVITFPATPGPVQSVPDYESVTVTVNRNVVSTDPTITATYNGGKGLGMTTRMDVTVIRSDGEVETGSKNYPVMGTAITLMGTTASDRVIVAVTMTSGDPYTIIDGYYPFPGSMVPS